MALQGSINPTTTQVLWVDSPAELYWKARTYGTYNGKGWLSENTVKKPLGYIPEFTSENVDLLRAKVTYSVTPLYASKQLFSGDQVLEVDRAVVIETQAQPLFTIDIAGMQQGKELPSYLRDVGESLVQTVEDGGIAVSAQDLADSLPRQFRPAAWERAGGRDRGESWAETTKAVGAKSCRLGGSGSGVRGGAVISARARRAPCTCVPMPQGRSWRPPALSPSSSARTPPRAASSRRCAY